MRASDPFRLTHLEDTGPGRPLPLLTCSELAMLCGAQVGTFPLSYLRCCGCQAHQIYKFQETASCQTKSFPQRLGHPVILQFLSYKHRSRGSSRTCVSSAHKRDSGRRRSSTERRNPLSVHFSHRKTATQPFHSHASRDPYKCFKGVIRKTYNSTSCSSRSISLCHLPQVCPEHQLTYTSE